MSLAANRTPPLAGHPVFTDLPETVFESMSRLARQHGAINLGQGFPDGQGPDDVRAAAARALESVSNQYPPMMGLPSLRTAIAAHYRHHQGLDLDPEREVMVTSGATEALAGALIALVRRAGGVPRFVTLKPPHFRIEEAALAAVFSERTRLVLLNNPLNPSATVFGADDLGLLAAFCRRFEAIAICDEVWEHVIFDGRRHLPLMALPGMRERTVKIGSAGKIFSLTGWKVGFVMAAEPLMRVLSRAHQFLTFTTPPNLQEAVAYGLGKDDAYFEGMRADLARSRDRLAAGLSRIGFTVLPSAGTYFLTVDLAGLADDDVAFCQRIVAEHGVAAIPVSAFYAQGSVKTLARFCFAKADDTLDAAVERLAGLFRAA